MEKTLILKIREFHNNKNEQPKDFKQFENLKINQNFKPNKYCRIHNSTTHDLKDCYLNKKNKKNTDWKNKEQRNERYNKKNSEKGLVLTEKIFVNDLIEIPCVISEKKFKCVLDTGSTKSYVSEKILDKTGLQKEKLDKNLEILAADSKIIKISEKCNLKVNLGASKNEIIDSFYVLKNLPVDLLIGNDLLTKYGSIINLKNQEIVFNKQKIILNEKQADYNKSVDKELIDKFFINKDEGSLSHLINSYKNKNDKFKFIKTPPVVIKQINPEKIVKSQQYYQPYKYYDTIKKEIQRLIYEKIIKEKNSLNSSPGFIIAKKNSECRLVIDYRQINTNLYDLNTGIPKIFENIQLLGNNKFFTKLDLKNGFNQLRIAKESQDITGFTILNRNFVYRRVPFGIKIGPKLFQQQIQNILKNCANCFVYIDDIIIYAKTETEHDKYLYDVLKKLFEYDVRLNIQKSDFKLSEVEILGHRIKENSIEIIKNNLENNIFKGERPNSIRKMQKLIGCLNWYRNFIPNFSNKVKSLTDKLNDKTNKNSKGLIWTSLEEEALKNILFEIRNCATLKFPEFNKPLYLNTDASDYGLGSVLYQDHGVLAYYSKKLHGAELNYSVIEKEFLSILRSLQYFRNLFKEIKFILKLTIRTFYQINSTLIKELAVGRYY